MFKYIKILSVSIKGFKCFKEKTVFNFYDHSRILGDNYKGKTSIAESIAWAFLGTNLWGNDKFDTHLLCEESTKMEVRVSFTDGEEVHNLIRTRSGKNTNIVLNQLSIKQVELTDLVGSKNIFLSIFNPMYFRTLDTKEGRELFVSILKNVDQADILAEMVDYLNDSIQEDLVVIHSNPNEYMKQRRSEISEYEKNLLFNEGVLSKLDTTSECRELKTFDDTELIQIEKDLDNLQYAKKEPVTKEYEVLVDEKNRLEKEIIKISAATFKKVDITEEYRKLSDYEKNISIIEAEKFEIKEELLKQKQLLENEYYSLRSEYSKSKELPIREGEECPTCKTRISHIHLEMITESKRDILKKLAAMGKEKAEQLDKLNKEIEHAQEVFTETKKIKLGKLRNIRSELSEKLKTVEIENLEKEKVFNAEKSKNIKQYEEKIAFINKEMETIKQAYLQEEITKKEMIDSQKEQLREKFTLLRKEKNNVDAYNLEVKLNIDQRLKDITEKQNILLENDNINKKINECKNKIEFCKKYTAIKVQKLSGIIHSNLTDLTIVLEKIIKSSGELKDCFEMSYKGKEYLSISASEKIRAGIEISNLVLNITGCVYPIFIDDKESITSYVAPNTQIIEANVIANEDVHIINIAEAQKDQEEKDKIIDNILNRENEEKKQLTLAI